MAAIRFLYKVTFNSTSFHISSFFLFHSIGFNFFVIQAYSTAPHVFVTAVHKHDPLNSNSENKHDAAIVWAEDVTYQGFRACVRELKNFDGIHKNVQVVSTSALEKASVLPNTLYSLQEYYFSGPR